MLKKNNFVEPLLESKDQEWSSVLLPFAGHVMLVKLLNLFYLISEMGAIVSLTSITESL